MKTRKDSTDSKLEPTKSELEILTVLWEYGPSTVRFVNDKLSESRDINYTSTLKLMQIMTEKGILTRDESQMKHVYHVVEDATETRGFLLKKFVDSVYKGSAINLMMQLLGDTKTTSQELQNIKDMLKNLNKE